MAKETNNPDQTVLKFTATLKPGGVYEMKLKTLSKDLYDAIWQLINNFAFNDTETVTTDSDTSDKFYPGVR